MAEPFLAEIRIMSFNFAPQGWALCNGQLMQINTNQALFSLLGTMYGGNGQTTFALPNLRGQVPLHVGNGHTQGEVAGSTSVTLNQTQMPTHVHTLQASTVAATLDTPSSTTLLGGSAPNDLYSGFASPVSTIPSGVSNVGGSQPHNNMMPYLVLSFCIAIQGIFPSRN